MSPGWSSLLGHLIDRWGKARSKPTRCLRYCIGAAIAWLFLSSFATTATAAALRGPRSVLVVHSGDYPHVEQVRAELIALNFQVMLLNDHESRSEPIQLSEAARENRASVAIEFIVTGEALQLWLYDTATGRAPTVQQFHYSSTSREAGRIEALQVVEYLRAALIQRDLPASPADGAASAATPSNALSPAVAVSSVQVKPIPQTAVVSAAGNPQPEEPSGPASRERSIPFRGRPPSLWLTLAPGIAVMNRLSVPVPAVSGGLSWQVTPMTAWTLQGLVPLTTSDLSSSLGKSDVKALGIHSLVRHNLSSSSSRWQPMLGGGLTLFWVEKGYQVLAPVPSGEMGIHWHARETWTVFASLLVGLPIWVSDDVKKKWGELDDLSRPAIFFASLGLEWRAVAWGKRD